jgi:hypothetical protein
MPAPAGLYTREVTGDGRHVIAHRWTDRDALTARLPDIDARHAAHLHIDHARPATRHRRVRHRCHPRTCCAGSRLTRPLRPGGGSCGPTWPPPRHRPESLRRPVQHVGTPDPTGPPHRPHRTAGLPAPTPCGWHDWPPPTAVCHTNRLPSPSDHIGRAGLPHGGPACHRAGSHRARDPVPPTRMSLLGTSTRYARHLAVPKASARTRTPAAAAGPPTREPRDTERQNRAGQRPARRTSFTLARPPVLPSTRPPVHPSHGAHIAPFFRFLEAPMPTPHTPHPTAGRSWLRR